MRYLKNLLILILLFFYVQCSCAFAQGKYSDTAIQFYNSGVEFQKQNKYELAEQKYNQALLIQPNFTEARTNLLIIYQNLSYKCYSTLAYEKSIYYAKKALSVKPNDLYSYTIMARCYTNMNDSQNAITNYLKALSLKPEDTSTMHDLAQIYINSNRFDKAKELYNKILIIAPDDKIAKSNLEYVNFQQSEKTLSESLNNLNIQHTAPEKLYKLIKGASPYTKEDIKTILDLVWSEPSGQIMLRSLMKKKTPIYIIQVDSKANARKTQQKHTIYAYGIIPIASFTISTNAVYIPIKYINNFKDTNLSPHQRIYNLQVFVHEFGHAFMNIKNPKNINSIEEELGVSMIGYNIAHKVITGKYLDKDQTQIYSKDCLEALLLDEHRELPVFSGFNNTIQSYGITMPYPEIYTNPIPIYKQLLAEKKINPVPNFYEYLYYNDVKR